MTGSTASSHTYIALLRGINVGGHHKLPMKDLVTLLERLGYEDVKTYIQSGNVVFRSRRNIGSKEAAKISDAIEAGFGFRPRLLILSKAELRAAVERNPFPTDEGKFLHFFFLEAEPEAPDFEALEAVMTKTEQFRLHGQVFYLYTPDGFGVSKLAERAERYLGVPATARNFNTVSKLMEMAQG